MMSVLAATGRLVLEDGSVFQGRAFGAPKAISGEVVFNTGMRERKKFWLAPIIIVLVLLGSLIVLTQGSAIAPFIYTLF